MSRMPTQNVGTLRDRTLCALVSRPSSDRGLSAPKNAIGSERIIARANETNAS